MLGLALDGVHSADIALRLGRNLVSVYGTRGVFRRGSADLPAYGRVRARAARQQPVTPAAAAKLHRVADLAHARLSAGRGGPGDYRLRLALLALSSAAWAARRIEGRLQVAELASADAAALWGALYDASDAHGKLAWAANLAAPLAPAGGLAAVALRAKEIRDLAALTEAVAGQALARA